MDLRFVNRRFAEALRYGDPAAETRPWLAGIELSGSERLQLEAIAYDVSPSGLSFDAFLAGGLDFHLRHTDEMALAPLEWWRVVDAGGVAVCDVWLFQVDGGVVYRAGTSEALGNLCQFHWDPFVDDEELGPALEIARATAVAAEPTAELRRYRFGGSE